jgi:DNA-binding transcriptional MocR family regulator
MWLPRLDDSIPTLSGRLAAAIQADITSGALPAGAKLPPHRDLAHRLGIGIGTVTAVYADLARRGLIDATVGRGSYVSAAAMRAAPTGPISLSYNVCPLGPADHRFAATLSRLRSRPDLLDHLAYAPPAGLEAHRRSGAAWLGRANGLDTVDAARLIVTEGAQQALGLAFGALCRPGDTILTEAATFFGVKALAQHVGYALHGLAMDEQGLLPEALDRAAAAGARVVYTMPTLQNPTGRIMGLQRRRDIAKVARARDLWIVEDDIYGAFATGAAPPPLATFAPERTLYISGVSKILAPGVRTGYLVVPNVEMLERIRIAIRALSYAPGTIGSLVASQWIDDGTADEIAGEIAAELRIRHRLGRALLGPALAPGADDRCPHLWLPLSELEAERLAARALRGGVELTPPAAPIVDGSLIAGVRLCIGATPARDDLERALGLVATALTTEIGERAMATI